MVVVYWRPTGLSREPLIIPATLVEEGGEDTCPTEQQRENVITDQPALRKRLGCTMDMGSLRSNPADSYVQGDRFTRALHLVLLAATS